MCYSLDFRKQVFKIKQQGKLTFQEASERFGVPIRTLFRWQQRIEPKIKRNKPFTKIDMEALRKDVEQNPNHYQYERARRVGVEQSTICYALKRLGLSNKKTLSHLKADPQSRLSFQQKLLRYEFIDKRTIVYLDESGFAVDVLRNRGYSLNWSF